MDITSANMMALRRLVNTAWAMGLEWKAPVDLSFLMWDVPGTGAANLYAWANFSAQFREWIGDRVWNSLSGEMYEVPHRDFEKSEKVKANLIKDDLYNVFVDAVRMHGSAWRQLLADW